MTNRPKAGETTQDAALLGRRDAFHVPGVLVRTNSFWLEPGDNVSWVPGSGCTLVEGCDEGIGTETDAIVDPFLNSGVGKKSGLFWVFPLPGKVKDLTHQFTLDGDELAQPAPVVESTVNQAVAVVTVAKKCIVCSELANPEHGICDDCAEYDKNDSCRGCYD